MNMTSRIDYSKYDIYYTEVSNAINANPNTECMQQNCVPHEWSHQDQYSNILDPHREGKNYERMVNPRPWSFEISTVHDNTVILVFSKIISKVWPDANAVVRRLNNLIEDSKTMNGSQLKAKYQTQSRKPKDLSQTQPVRRTMARATSGDFKPTSTGAKQFASTSPRGNVPALGNKRLSFAPAPRG